MRSQRAIALFTILATLRAGPVQGGWTSDQVDVSIPVRDGKPLSANVYRPPKEGTYPAVSPPTISDCVVASLAITRPKPAASSTSMSQTVNGSTLLQARFSQPQIRERAPRASARGFHEPVAFPDAWEATVGQTPLQTS